MDLRKYHILGMTLALAMMGPLNDASATALNKWKKHGSGELEATPLVRSWAAEHLPALPVKTSFAPSTRSSTLSAPVTRKSLELSSLWQESVQTQQSLFSSISSGGTRFAGSVLRHPNKEEELWKKRYNAAKVFGSVFGDVEEDCQSALHRSLLSNAVGILSDLNTGFEAIAQLLGREWDISNASAFSVLQNAIAKQIFSMDSANAQNFQTEFARVIEDALPALDAAQKSSLGEAAGIAEEWEMVNTDSYGRRVLRELLSALESYFAAQVNSWEVLGDDLTSQTVDPHLMQEKMHTLHVQAYEDLNSKPELYDELLSEAISAYNVLASTKDQKSILQLMKTCVQRTAIARALIRPATLPEGVSGEQLTRDMLQILYELEIPARPGEPYDAETNHLCVPGVGELAAGTAQFGASGNPSLRTVQDSLVHVLVTLQDNASSFAIFQQQLEQRQYIRTVLTTIPSVIENLNSYSVHEYIALSKALLAVDKRNTDVQLEGIIRSKKFPKGFDLKERKASILRRFRRIPNDEKLIQFGTQYLLELQKPLTPQ